MGLLIYALQMNTIETPNKNTWYNHNSECYIEGLKSKKMYNATKVDKTIFYNIYKIKSSLLVLYYCYKCLHCMCLRISIFTRVFEYMCGNYKQKLINKKLNKKKWVKQGRCNKCH